MYSDGNQFYRRALHFLSELQSDSYPNAPSLGRLCNCSARTAQRLIDRLRDEYSWPLEYDSARRGYRLSDPNFSFSALPPGRDELTALVMLRELAECVDDAQLKDRINSLWVQYRTSSPGLRADLERASQFFSSETTELGVLADQGLLDYLNAAATGQALEIEYKSPWKHKEPRTYRGRVNHVHLSDGRLYILLLDQSGMERVLNCSFVRRFSVLSEPLHIDLANLRPVENWRSGFGVWAGQELRDIVVRIAPPAAEYFCRVRWDDSQEDSWDGEILVRKMRGIVSPELKRRVLSLGRYLLAVEPPELREAVLEDISILAMQLRDDM